MESLCRRLSVLCVPTGTEYSRWTTLGEWKLTGPSMAMTGGQRGRADNRPTSAQQCLHYKSTENCVTSPFSPRPLSPSRRCTLVRVLVKLCPLFSDATSTSTRYRLEKGLVLTGNRETLSLDVIACFDLFLLANRNRSQSPETLAPLMSEPRSILLLQFLSC